MIRTIKECLNTTKASEIVTVRGWVKTRRDSKAGLSFINLHDGSCFASLQLTVPQSLANYHEEVLHLTSGCSITATGRLMESQGKGQIYEVQVDALTVMGWVEQPETYPIQAKRHSLEFLREVAHLRPRTNTFSAVARIRHAVSYAVHQFFHQEGYYWVHTPIISASDCEGAGELFRVSTLDLSNLPRTDNNQIDFSKDFFQRETFLAVSGQLNLEAYCLALSKVYTFGPTFRAENSNTSRHLAEFWMIEPEVAFASLEDIAHLSQKFLKFLCQNLLENCSDDMEFFNEFIDPACMERLHALIGADFAELSYTEAIAILAKAPVRFEFPCHWGADLQSEHERYLAETYCKKPVIVTNYPKNIKSFYMRLNDDGETVAAMDLLAPGIGEIIGGSQREERLSILDERINACGLDPKNYQWYRDLRRYGTVPHAGFGLGLERFISYVTGLTNIRDVIPFPRTPGHAEF